jgi:hypothetical protein
MTSSKIVHVETLRATSPQKIRKKSATSPQYTRGDVARNVSTFCIIILTFLFASCDKFLDINPDNRADLDDFDKISTLLVSAYPDISYYYLTEMSSDNADQIDRHWQMDNRTQEEFFKWQDGTEDGQDTHDEIWRSFYKAIGTANHALDAIAKLDNSDSAFNVLIGEALLARAYAHFKLVNIFSLHYGTTSATDLGIPYVTEPEGTVAPHYERHTVAYVYERIDKDIKDGLRLLTNDNHYSQPAYRFTRRAANAFAAKFYLFYRKYEQAITHANAVLGANPLSMLRSWDGDIQTSTPLIRTREYTSSESRANLLLIPAISNWGFVNAEYSFAGSYYMHHEALSRRETDMAPGPWGGAHVLKFQPIPLVTDKVMDCKIGVFFEYLDPIAGTGYARIVQPVLTTDETLLIRAEANIMLENNNAAIADLALYMNNYTTDEATELTNTVIQAFYNRFPYYQFTPDQGRVYTGKKRLNPDFAIVSLQQENLLHCLLHIRRVVFRSEGQRWFDIKRYGIEIYRRSFDGMEYTQMDFLSKDDPRRALQLPINVISAGLKPNPR